MKKSLLSLIFASLTLLTSFGQDTNKTVVFKFNHGQNGLYVPLLGNDAEMAQLFSFIDTYRTDIESGRMPVRVDGYATSRSTEADNLALAKIRSNRVKSEMITHKGLQEKYFITHNHATEYSSMGDVVVVSFTLPEIRPSELTKPLPRPEIQPMPEAKPAPEIVIHKTDTVFLYDDEDIFFDYEETTVFDNYRAALRTNLAHWVLMTPNLGLELRFHRLGLIGHGGYSNWEFYNGAYKHKLWYINPEARIYMGSRGRFYLGGAYQKGQFNLKFDGKGRQGDFNGGSLTVGYQAKLSNRLDLDFGVGLGYTELKYDIYNTVSGVNVVENKDVKKRVIGPNQAAMTLVWKIWE